MAGLDKYIEEYNKSKGGTGTSSSQDEEKNKGGFWGGAEYLGTKFVDGFVSNIEGMVDFAVGGVAGLIGLGGNENAKEFAEDVFRDDWYNYERADEKYNPGKGMNVLGDIAGVVGGAVPDVAIGLLTGGLGWGAKAISAGTSLASSAGRGLNEAVNTTGDLGAKEWAGGIGSGVLSAGVELVSGGLGEFAGGVFGKTGVEMGGELAESLGKKASNETIESIFKKTVGKEAAGEFGESAVGKLVNSIWNSKTFRELAGEMTSEGLEESFETILEPFIKQNTYQPDAPNATLGDIAYSGFLGAVAGGVMSGSVNTLNNAITTKRGATIANNNNKLTSLFGNAEAIINYENKNDTGSQIFGAVSNMYQDIQNKLQESGGRMTASIYNDIGKLDALVASAVMQPSVVNAAKGVAQNAESMAEQLNSFYKKTGQNKTVTAEQLTKGLKLDGSSKDFVKSVTDALNTNATLREVVLNNMLGRLDFDAKVYANSIYGDTDIRSIATQQNINRFLGSADAATLGQTGEVLGISDWASLTPQELAEKIQQFRRNGGEEAFAEGISSIKEAQKAKGYTNGMPGDVSALKQGATRFKVGEADFAIIRHGDSYRLYDYNTGHITKSVQMGDMNSLVARLRERAAQVGRESEMQALDREIDNFAMENVPEYKSLTAAEKEAVRATLRYAQASGISMKDQILFARIAAKSGMNIITVKGLLDNKAAWYDGMNTVYIDSTSPRTRVFSGILGHELYHKMFKSDKRRKLFDSALQNIDQTLKDKTKEEYKAELRKLNRYTEQEIEAISDEEVAAAYAEKLFNTPGIWSYILDGEPNLGERVINFFKGSPKRYDFAPEMDPAAKAWIREYKKLFDEVARFNAGENVASNVQKIKRIGKIVDEDAVDGRATIQNIVGESGTDYGIGVYLDSTLLSGLTDAERVDMVKEYIKELGGKPFTAFDQNGNEVKVKIVESTAKYRNEKGKKVPVNRHLTNYNANTTKQEAIALVDELILTASQKTSEPARHKHGWLDNNGKNNWDVWKTFVKDKENTVWEATLQIANSVDGEKILYEIHPIKKVEGATKNSTTPTVSTDKSQNSPVIDKSISQNSKNSNAFDKKSAKDFKNEGRSALEDGNKATTSDVAAAKRAIREDGIDPSGIIELADKYFDRYNGKLTRTGVRYEFLAAAETMLDSRSDALDRAYQKIEALAEELTYNEKANGALAEELADVKRHIKEITFAVKDQDKGEFDSYGGFGEFRKQHFGKIKIANEGTSVDSSYGELQNLYGTNLFPDRNTAQEMLIRIAEVVDMDPTVQTETDADLEMISNETAVAITGELAVAFDKKLAAKGEKLSKTDAEAYKDRIRAREEARAAKAIAKAKKRFEKLEKQIREKAEKYASDVEAKANKTIETERTKLKAEYETDRVFSQAEVNKSLSTVETFKSLPKKVRDSISNQLWTAFNESNGYDSRQWLELKYTAELTDRIIRERDVAVTKYERDAIFEQVNAAMKQIAEGGKKSVRASMEGEIRNEITPKIKAEESTRRVILSEIYQSLKKIDDVKTQRFAAASDYKGRTFKGSIEHLTKMDWRGQLNDNIVRSEMTEILKWYQPENPMLKELENKELRTTMYDESIKHRLEVLSEGEGTLSNTELGMLSDTLAYFTKLINEYDQVYSEGKWQSGENLVYKMRDTIEKQDKMRMPLAIKGLRNRFWSGDFKAFGDPLSVMKAADMYEDGIFTRTYNDWMWGEINAQAEELSIKQEYDEFMKKNKKYLAGADKATVKLHDVEFNRLQLISYIMTLKRKGSWLGVLHEGVVFRDKNGKDVKMRALTPIAEGEGFNKKLQNAIEAERALAESLLTDKDRQYLEILERGFEKAKATKAAADMQRLGFVNVVDGYYYPIRRAYTEHLTEYEAELFATDRYANASFNKKSIEKAKSALLISSADAVFNSHVKGVSRYMYLSPVIDSFNKLYKLKVLKVKPGMGADIGALYATMDSTTSMQQTIAQAKSTWRQDGKIVGFDYLQNLMLDTMSSKPKAIGDNITGWFRSNYVGFALGANPKVLLTQFSSLFASTSVLNVGSHIGGIFTNAKGVDTYSVVARLRDSDYTIAKAMSVSDNVSRLSKWFTQGMSFFDRIVVKRAYAAAKVQVSREQGLKIGTEENSIAAGHLLDKVILETQQNAMSSRKTEAARRGNMLAKTMIMFKSDAITTMGRVIDAWGEYQYLLAKKKDADGDSKGEYDGQLENARKQIYRTAGAVVAGSIYMVIVSEAFKKFYGKDDEDEKGGEKALRRLGEFALNVIGGMPVFSSIIEACTSFSGLESIEFSAINDILTTANKLKDVIGDMADGKADNRDKLRAIERTLFTLGQLTGIPARNIKNFMYAITRLISPEAAYKWNNALYDQSYASDLADALEKGDYDMAEVILELAFGDKMGSGLSDEAIKELMRLAKLGESVVPGAIGDTVTVDGVEREITGKELKAIREKYGEAIDQINKFLKTDLYKSFDDEQKADAVRKIYNLYKNLAYDEVLGTEKDRDMHILSKVLDMDSLVALEAVSIFSSDKDEEGETIDGSRREKILAAILNLDISDEDKLLMIGASGYTLNNGDIPGMSGYAASEMLYNYISELDGISEEERLRIYDICGFKVKNEGAIPDTPTNGDFEYELDQGDVENATDIFNKVVLDKLGQSFKESTSGEIIRLAQIGDKFADKVMPSAISDKVTINGEERELTKEEYAVIKEKYGESVQRIDTFLESDLYKSYTDEQKASAIAKIYDLYKNLAYDSTLGTEKDKEALILYGVVDPDVLCAWETMSVLESDKDADGNTIAGSKRKKIVEAINNLDASDEEKLLLIAMKGYSLKDGDVSGLTAYQADVKLYNYILSLDLSEEERIVLFKAAGFDVKNGEVQKPSASGGSSSGSSSSKRTSSSSKSSSGGSLTNPSGPLSRVTRNRVRRIGKIV